MNEQETNIQFVKDVFTALNKGDLQSVLGLVADTVDWQSPVTSIIAEPITWAKPRRSREEVGVFFKEFFEKVKPIEMKPVTYTAQDDRVCVEGTTTGVVNATGREYKNNWVMMITLRNGKCVRLRHYYDTTDVSKAFSTEIRKAA